MLTPLTENTVRDALKEVRATDMDKDVVTTGLVRRIAIEEKRVIVSVEMPTMVYPAEVRAKLEADLGKALDKVASGHEIELHFSAVVHGRGRTSADKRLPGVRNVIAVASGKGGVGKSTVATNLALALAKQGAKVGLLDADIYGPSIPQMLGPASRPVGNAVGEKIHPSLHHGIQVMSVGFFVEQKGAVIWRGPMVHKLLTQFMEDVEWGELDYLLVDLPPGTGDVQISLSQLIPLTGAVMVTTPQEVALIDVVRGISMFEKVEVPILGIIENMSYYVCSKCGHQEEIFDAGGGRKLAEQSNTVLLGEIPLHPMVRQGGDAGVPVVVGKPESEHAKQFLAVASRLAWRIATLMLRGPRRAAGLVAIS